MGFFAVEDQVRARHFLRQNPLRLKRTQSGDFTHVFSGYYPILERFEPMGPAFQKRAALLLQRFLPAHSFGLLRDESLAVSIFADYLLDRSFKAPDDPDSDKCAWR